MSKVYIPDITFKPALNVLSTCTLSSLQSIFMKNTWLLKRKSPMYACLHLFQWLILAIKCKNVFKNPKWKETICIACLEQSVGLGCWNLGAFRYENCHSWWHLHKVKKKGSSWLYRITYILCIIYCSQV